MNIPGKEGGFFYTNYSFITVEGGNTGSSLRAEIAH
jgi:hypothetical protein